MDPTVTLLADQYTRGGAIEGASLTPLSEVLRCRYTTDAHFQQGIGDGSRFKKATIGIEAIQMTALAIDLDAPRKMATLGWRLETRARIERLFEDYPGGYAHETPGGCRVVYALASPIVIAEAADADAWRRRYLALLAAWRATYGLECDTACADCTRLYRCPHATRDGVPLNLPAIGSPRAIGTIEPATGSRPE